MLVEEAAVEVGRERKVLRVEEAAEVEQVVFVGDLEIDNMDGSMTFAEPKEVVVRNRDADYHLSMVVFEDLAMVAAEDLAMEVAEDLAMVAALDLAKVADLDLAMELAVDSAKEVFEGLAKEVVEDLAM